MIELKPCPMCGDAWLFGDFYKCRVACKCGYAWLILSEWFPSKDQATEAWNGKVDIPHKCGNCADFANCEEYVDANETFPEAIGGCQSFQARKGK